MNLGKYIKKKINHGKNIAREKITSGKNNSRKQF